MKQFLHEPHKIPVRTYQCPVCETVFGDEAECIACCKGHPRIDKVLGHSGVWYIDVDAPEDLILEDSKGRKIVYTFHKVLRDEDNKTEENNDEKND